ncbi:Flavonoid 3'-monooxygenase protein [Dioscorea alata]|uniref:Flavonoid 3'-monooxygenase protein n=1 Tax=Dioscorea alata TaxID=55571 RepID=A0ACB7V4K7_DIOAL|nr:Flavonoid 3'-monooxygenase protein [Dioscorea alata]
MEAGLDLTLAIATKSGFLTGAANQLPLAGVLFLCLLTFITIIFIHWATPGGSAWSKLRFHNRKPIPGPRGFPLIGSMSLMHGLAHRKLAAEAKAHKAERLMAFSLGNTRVIITSNPDVAKEILNSSAFVDRPAKYSAHALMFHRAIGFAPFGSYWRALRRIAATHLFSPKQITTSSPRRKLIADQMVEALRCLSCSGDGVGAREVVKRAALNHMMWSVFGRGYEILSESEEMRELRGLVDEAYELLGTLNWSDHLGFLSGSEFGFEFGFDPQGIMARCDRLVPKVNRFVSMLIDEHRGSAAKLVPHDFVDVLLSLEDKDRLSDSDMAAVLWEMIFRGTDTVAVVIEWVLARLIMHQDVQDEVHKELDRVVGIHGTVTEMDVGSLVYLNAVIKEVLRLHPPGPLLSWARLATCDTHVDGNYVPAGTTAMVNMWAITHDPHVWESPYKFCPERFIGSNLAEFQILGSDLRLAPFGSGRRNCPGKSLAMTTVTFWVASLLHEFEWAPPSNGTRVDLSEVLKLSCEMVIPLTARLYPRRVTS